MQGSNLETQRHISSPAQWHWAITTYRSAHRFSVDFGGLLDVDRGTLKVSGACQEPFLAAINAFGS